MTERKNEYGVIGLARTGGNLARQALKKGMRVVGFTRHGTPPDMIEAGLVEVRSYEDLKGQLSPQRIVFLYISSGPAVYRILGDVAQEFEEGDVLGDGGNVYWIAMMPHGFGAHAYGHSEPVVRERREGRIGSFLREYTEAPCS